MFSPRAIQIAILTAVGALLVIAAWGFALLSPCVAQADVDNLHPPISLLLLVLPHQVWWVMPTVVVGATAWRHRRPTWIASSAAPGPRA